RRANESRGVMHQSDRLSKLETALQSKPFLRDRVIEITQLSVSPESLPGSADSREFLRQLVGHLPNETRIEMVRISRDREAQAQIAQMFVKSTSAICTAIGTQPIPLADLPILTTLQLLMVSGIMHSSGREKNLRAATEFIGALGVNIGAGMVLREGTRALLKFLPGWGNVLCGMVAGAGTYAIGRAAVVYFIEGMSLRDARLTYLANRKKRTRAKLPERTPALMPQ
ncbi:MAG: YcjF family protein, partial [Chthoniobacterales bacterium]